MSPHVDAVWLQMAHLTVTLINKHSAVLHPPATKYRLTWNYHDIIDVNFFVRSVCKRPCCCGSALRRGKTDCERHVHRTWLFRFGSASVSIPHYTLSFAQRYTHKLTPLLLSSSNPYLSFLLFASRTRLCLKPPTHLLADMVIQRVWLNKAWSTCCHSSCRSS